METEVDNVRVLNRGRLEVFPSTPPAKLSSCLAHSSKFGLTFFAAPGGLGVTAFAAFEAATLESVAKAEENLDPLTPMPMTFTVSLPSPPHLFALSPCEEVIAVHYAHVLAVFEVAQLQTGPIFTQDGITMENMSWSPFVDGKRFLAFLTSTGSVHVYNTEGDFVCHYHEDVDFKAIAWHPSDSVVAVGDTAGCVHKLQFTFDADECVGSFNKTTTLVADHVPTVNHLNWAEDDLLFAGYATPDGDEAASCIFEGGAAVDTTDLVAYFPSDDRPHAFYSCYLQPWRMFFVGCSLSTDIELLVSEPDSGEWQVWKPPEKYTPRLPMDRDDEDTYPVGMALALNSRAAIPGDDLVRPFYPCPLLLIATTDGVILNFALLDTDETEFPSLVTPVPLPPLALARVAGKNVTRHNTAAVDGDGDVGCESAEDGSEGSEDGGRSAQVGGEDAQAGGEEILSASPSEAGSSHGGGKENEEDAPMLREPSGDADTSKVQFTADISQALARMATLDEGPGRFNRNPSDLGAGSSADTAFCCDARDPRPLASPQGARPTEPKCAVTPPMLKVETSVVVPPTVVTPPSAPTTPVWQQPAPPPLCAAVPLSAAEGELWSIIGSFHKTLQSLQPAPATELPELAALRDALGAVQDAFGAIDDNFFSQEVAVSAVVSQSRLVHEQLESAKDAADVNAPLDARSVATLRRLQQKESDVRRACASLEMCLALCRTTQSAELLRHLKCSYDRSKETYNHAVTLARHASTLAAAPPRTAANALLLELHREANSAARLHDVFGTHRMASPRLVSAPVRPRIAVQAQLPSVPSQLLPMMTTLVASTAASAGHLSFQPPRPTLAGVRPQPIKVPTIGGASVPPLELGPGSPRARKTSVGAKTPPPTFLVPPPTPKSATPRRAGATDVKSSGRPAMEPLVLDPPDYLARLEGLRAKFAPTKCFAAASLERLLEEHRGRESALFLRVLRQCIGDSATTDDVHEYLLRGVLPATPVRDNPHRVRLVTFYEKHNPTKLPEVDMVLLKYHGNEAKLFRDLETKYQVAGRTTTSPWGNFYASTGFAASH
ncbi:nuclear pore complex protein [Achlya hypogyna]|uniref:Nuclear pore complex protein n=1 Tax=Achlya hypogyna TaxID=1202772 RepID=A0A1V9ZKZ3_ACHHY|nr:nuclear pore complex protein [Achlya hypogyna]